LAPTQPDAQERAVDKDGAVKPLLLSVDFEDWHQLIRRRVGAGDWERPGPALERQTCALLELFDELGVRVTFFVLGMAARSHPRLIAEIAAQGHEIACHGDRHEPVHRQTPQQFAADLRAARVAIAQISGSSPLGYRAPAFSITADARWAFEVLAQEGFAYDSSQHDSPVSRARIMPATRTPHPLALDCGATIWEFPIAVGRVGRIRVPVGGASYWSVLPTGVVLRCLEGCGSMSGLYLHPYEADPQPLHAELSPGTTRSQRARATLRSLQRNGARRRTPDMLRAIAARHRLITYGEAHARLSSIGQSS
jgi:polysaccharide deacetylase family protein (PEP-CTERM system associated)